MHCSSFSKCLAPGYRVGWVAAGRFAPKVERLKLMTLLTGSVPVQDAIATYLRERPYEAHLRRLVELPGGDAMELFDAAFADGVSLAPGPMFSARQEFRRCIRLNTGQVWTPAIEQGIVRLAHLATAAARAPG